jgi:hypothetical protein
MAGSRARLERAIDEPEDLLARLGSARARLDGAEREFRTASRDYERDPHHRESDRTVEVLRDRLAEARGAYEATLAICQETIAANVTRLSQPTVDAEGFDLRPDPLSARTPAELVAALRQYRIWAGLPSFRDMADRARREVAPSTLCTALRGNRMPRLPVVMAVIVGCGGGKEDQRIFATAWRRIKSGLLMQPGPSEPAFAVMRNVPEADFRRAAISHVRNLEP